MDDSSSIDSFEEINHSPISNKSTNSSPFQWKSSEDKNFEKLKCLIAKSAAKGNVARELVEDEVPDVCYVLQYKGWGGKLVDVRRSLDPIDIQLDEVEGETTTSIHKSVLEIVTVISTTLVRKQPPRYRGVPPPPPPPPPPQAFGGISYGGYNDFSYSNNPAYRPRYEDGSEMNIAKVEKTAMVINSPHLINALKAVVGYYPGISLLGDNVKIMAPYQVLFHHRTALELYKNSQPETHDTEYEITTANHIDILLNFLEKNMGEEIREEERRHNNVTPAATFDKLWLLLKPGEVVYAKYDQKWTPFVISAVSGGPESNIDGIGPYIIHCWNITFSMGFSTTKLCRTMHSFTVNPFSGEEAITSLPMIPARFFKGDKGDMSPQDVTEKQIRLGKMVWSLSKGPSYMSYDGSLVEKSPENNWSYSNNATGYMSGRVIIDPEGYSRFSGDCPGNSRPRVCAPPTPLQPGMYRDQLPYFAPRCSCNACSVDNQGECLSPFAEFDDCDPTCDAAPRNDLYYVVLTKVVGGFVLGERRWGHFNVEHLEEIKYEKEAFKYLVLDDEIKHTVKALIGKFANAQGRVSPWPNDFVKNKGQGRIFLLHGSPGVGKTCTAECVAELTHRPLISLTSGDLSTKSYHVEKNLEYFLQLGERFGAMVLLDEADVYLEARRAQDIARNGLVSIFLRALEYYRGVLFLTTNRVQTFDAAFTSRIHVALHYRALTDADRERIWQSSFERLERDSAAGVRVAASARDYAYTSRDLRALRWNGREIRNALQTAVALAESDALEDDAEIVTVTDRHLRSVVKMSRGFKDFLSQRRRRLRAKGGAAATTGRLDGEEDDGVEGEEEEEEEEGREGEDEGAGVLPESLDDEEEDDLDAAMSDDIYIRRRS
ncbi:P-loop containing nucleoside triphosphate hydrolase protein [Camillea tinctor]|nr:P-loop containing nucleoside triphosphate hydrolase protein [Camillea tinctor]